MNNRVAVNPELILKCDFKHLFTYKLLFHVMAYYDAEVNKVKIDKKEIRETYIVSHKTLNVAVEELLEKEIIVLCPYCKNHYRVKTNFIVKYK